MGTLVGSSRFVPLRVPLNAKYLPQFERMSEEIWAPSDFLEAQEAQNLDVKMIIDLTNTFKYYNGYEEFQDSGVHYVKLRIEGFNGPPAAKDVAKFMEIVDEFVAKEPEGAIAVHCTHGLNRTGYLIVNYLVERLAHTVTQALEAFKAARPPGLIKHMYVEELYQRLGKEEEEVQLPELPDWASAKYSKRAKEGNAAVVAIEVGATDVAGVTIVDIGIVLKVESTEKVRESVRGMVDVAITAGGVDMVGVATVNIVAVLTVARAVKVKKVKVSVSVSVSLRAVIGATITAGGTETTSVIVNMVAVLTVVSMVGVAMVREMKRVAPT